MTITRNIRAKLKEIRKKITKDIPNKMNFGEVINHLIDFYNKHSESDVLAAIPTPKLVVKPGSVILQRKGVMIHGGW